MDKGGKVKLIVLILIVLFFSILVTAKQVSDFSRTRGIDNNITENITEINITDIINETEIVNVSESNVPLDVSIETINFDKDLKLNEELYLIVKIKSNYEEDVRAIVYVEIIKVDKRKEKEIFLFDDKEEVFFNEEVDVAFGPIIFRDSGDYEVKVKVEPGLKEENQENNKLTSLFFFPFLMCEDGTYYNECNENLLYCENSYLIEKCSICGCLEGFECVDERCVKIIGKEREQENISYIYSGNKRIAEIKNENTYYYHYDNIGSVRKVTDENQEAVLSVDYLPFGEKYFKDGYGSGYEYTGKEFDDSGLNYYGARYYDSSIGRFVTVDPIGSGINWYAYVDNNPLVKVDPNGLKSTKVDLYLAGLNLVEPISDYSEMSITDRYGKKEEENKIIENGVVLDEQQAKQKRFALVHGIHLFPGNVHDDEGYRNIMLAARERGYLTEEFDTFTVGPASVVECSLEQLGVDTVASKRLIEQGYTGDYDYTVRFSGGNILVPGDVGAGFSETPENKIVLTITDPVQLSSFLLFGGKAYDVKFGWGHDKNSDSVSEAGYYYFDHPNLKNGRFVLESTGVILENLGVDRFKHDQIAKWSIKVSKPF